jgi:hypothetical protein
MKRVAGKIEYELLKKFNLESPMTMFLNRPVATWQRVVEDFKRVVGMIFFAGRRVKLALRKVLK